MSVFKCKYHLGPCEQHRQNSEKNEDKEHAHAYDEISNLKSHCWQIAAMKRKVTQHSNMRVIDKFCT